MATKNTPKLDRFDPYVPAEPWVNPWQADGSYGPDLDLLTKLLSIAAGTAQQSGVVAAAADVWAAEELRRAGFEADEVWPRRTKPRVLPRDVRNFVEGGALTKKLREQVEERLTHPQARKALPAEAHVLGSAFSKQADVLIASWAAGVELLISTKTMLSSYQKNLRNRFEEGYGDAKNLRGRHPLASLGFLYIVGSDIPDSSLAFAIDMLRKLTREADVYESACLLILDGDGADAVEEDEGGLSERGPEEDPALVPLPAVDGEFRPDDTDESETVAQGTTKQVRLLSDKIPEDLAPSTFFKQLITTALERTPVGMYPEVRSRLTDARDR